MTAILDTAGIDCNPSCRFYFQMEAMSDQEIIDEHNRDVERMRQEGRIVETTIRRSTVKNIIIRGFYNIIQPAELYNGGISYTMRDL